MALWVRWETWWISALKRGGFPLFASSSIPGAPRSNKCLAHWVLCCRLLAILKTLSTLFAHSPYSPFFFHIFFKTFFEGFQCQCRFPLAFWHQCHRFLEKSAGQLVGPPSINPAIRQRDPCLPVVPFPRHQRSSQGLWSKWTWEPHKKSWGDEHLRRKLWGVSRLPWDTAWWFSQPKNMKASWMILLNIYEKKMPNHQFVMIWVVSDKS